EDAEKRGDATQAGEFLHRLVPIPKSTEDKVRFALREAELLAGTLDDVDAAVERYRWILDQVDPKNRDAVQKIAALEEKRDNHAGVADALERELKIVTEDADRLEIARKLAGLYE